MTEKQEKQINDTSLNNQAFWHFAEGLFFQKEGFLTTNTVYK